MFAIELVGELENMENEAKNAHVPYIHRESNCPLKSLVARAPSALFSSEKDITTTPTTTTTPITTTTTTTTTAAAKPSYNTHGVRLMGK